MNKSHDDLENNSTRRTNIKRICVSNLNMSDIVIDILGEILGCIDKNFDVLNDKEIVETNLTSVIIDTKQNNIMKDT